MTDKDSKFAWGVPAIAEEIERKERATYYLISRGCLPVEKVGGTYVAERAKLRNPASWPKQEAK
jgi:hypothetical protein